MPPVYINVNMKTGETANHWIDALQAAWSGVQVMYNIYFLLHLYVVHYVPALEVWYESQMQAVKTQTNVQACLSIPCSPMQRMDINV